MALKLVKELSSGLLYEYHRISCIELKNHIRVEIESYKDQSARDDGKEPAERQYVKLNMILDHESPLLEQLYSKLKEEVFVGAIDC